uniref:Myosin phosphatase Rho interacting protein n=1 Tax=Pavo cristatus TaxID=9049 RepID=A0A8C9ETH6_PAVCR
MAAKDNPCRKFQANIFNKSKCQNCFKPRESHLLNDEDLNQAKPIYGGWLLLAPEGTDFDNPVHRSRKWQRRFFILYEHGLLRYALDEMPTTLPQGTINMNQCTDVVDGESRTGQKFSLCILTPEKEHFIRADPWLAVKPLSSTVPCPHQEPGPAKMAVTSSNIPSAEKVPTTKSTLWQEEMRGKEPADTSSSISPAQSPVQGAASSLKDPILDSKEDESSMNGDRIDCGRKTRVESGYFSLEKTKQDSKLEEQQLPPPPSPPSPSTPNNRRSQVIEKFEALDIENTEHMETSVPAGAALSSETRQGRSEKRVFPRKRVSSFHTTVAPLRSHGGVWVEHSGIMCRAALLAQPMQICCSLSLPEEKSKTSSSFEPSPKPSEKPDAEQTELDPEQKRSRARERRREGRSKTFDWAEFRPIQQALAQERANAADSSKSGTAAFPRDSGTADTDPGELERERARRREERRKRFEMVDTVDGAGPEETLRMEVDRILPVPADLKPQNVHVEIEQRWHQVETTPLREEKQIPIAPLHLAHAEDRDEGLAKQHLTTLLEKELEQKQKEALELLEQNRHLQDQLKVALGREQSAREGYVLQATCERGFAAMEETHQKKIEDLQRQHQRELEKLREEKDRLLAEETAATISAIEAMKNAHREELERELEKSQRSQISSVNADIEALRRQYLEELQSVQRELEVLSEQYSQKCLENAHLAQALEAERQALRQCQRENQELNAHNQELNNRLAAEITRLRTLLTGEGGGEAAGSPLTQGKDAYELEVLLRVKESEIQYLKQEISSLKDELQTALRDKKYASDKYKDIYTELSIVKAKADCDISRLKEQLKAATEAQGEKSPVNTTVSGYDIMKSKSNPDFLKKDRSSVSRQLRNIRSKVS